MQTLSNMYRRVVFARGFKLTVQEMYRSSVCRKSPTPDQIPAFVERVKRLLDRRSRWPTRGSCCAAVM